MAERLAIIDCGGADSLKLRNALARASPELFLIVDTGGHPPIVSEADRIVLAGRGGLAAAMQTLAAADGLVGALEHAVLVSKRPFLGIGAGMDALAEEDTDGAAGLDWIAGASGSPAWRASPQPLVVRARAPHPVLASLDHAPTAFAFQDHTRFDTENDAHLLAVADGAGGLPAVVGRDNILGVRFRPDLSGPAGDRLLADFLAWRP